MADGADDDTVDDNADSDATGASALSDPTERAEDAPEADDGLVPAVERVEGGADPAADPNADDGLTPAVERVEHESEDGLEREPYEHLPSAVERVEDTDAETGWEPESVGGTDYEYAGPEGAFIEPDEEVDESDIEDAMPMDHETAMEASETVGAGAETPAEPVGQEYGDPFAEGPESDEEMPLADHIEEMVKRLGVVIVVMAVVSGVVFPFGERLINFLWYSILPGTDVARPRVYHPLALVLARLKVATLAGFVVALPVLVYEAYLFMRPGLYQRERRYFLASVPTSLVLASVGVVFAWRLVLPALFTYFLRYSERATVIAFGLTQTFDLMLVIMGFFAVIFQIPLLIMLAIMMGVTSRAWLESRRLYFWGAFVGVALLFSPDPTGMVPFIVAATMLVLFEGTLLLLRWTGR